jgi:hypothetical protein
MIPRALLCVLGMLPALDARAQEPIGAEANGGREQPEESNRAPPPPRFYPTLDVTDVRLDEQTARFRLTQDTELHLGGAWSSTGGDPQAMAGDGPPPMWRATAGASHDLGWARVHATASYEDVQTELGRGRTVEAGVGITRTFRLTTGLTGFVSLTLGRRQSIGQAVPGEVEASQVMLSAGVRWR